MHRRPPRRLAAALALGAALAACSDGASTTAAGRGTVRLAITDAPFPFSEVARADIHLVRIDAKQAETSEGEADDGSKEENRQRGDAHDGWVTLAAPDAPVNLLELQSGRVMNLGQQTLATGTYRGFRLIIDPARSSITLKDGTKPSIKWPSAGRSGIKVKLEQPVAVTENGTQMVIDFDLGNSFVLRGHSIADRGLLFKPVVRGTARDVTGAVGGTVRVGSATGAAAGGASVQILRAGTAQTDTASANVLATTAAGADGAYKAAFLMPGHYAVRAAAGTAGAGFVADVTVTTGTTAAADVVLQ